jgi:hypothetical protein
MALSSGIITLFHSYNICENKQSEKSAGRPFKAGGGKQNKVALICILELDAFDFFDTGAVACSPPDILPKPTLQNGTAVSESDFHCLTSPWGSRRLLYILYCQPPLDSFPDFCGTSRSSSGYRLGLVQFMTPS